jgi:NADH-quinone oxidoreductase subunit J
VFFWRLSRKINTTGENLMTPATILFFVLALVAVVSAVGMLLSRNTVYAALLLIVNFGSIAMLYLVLGAPFIAFAQVTVYAGAIMVLFLFVIMLLGADRSSFKETLRWQRPLAYILGAAMLVEAAYILVFKGGAQPPLPTPAANFANPSDIGMALFNQYMLPFEITSVILLVATVGAIILTKPEKRKQSIRDQAISDQAEREQAISDQGIKDQAVRDQVERDRAISDRGSGSQ